MAPRVGRKMGRVTGTLSSNRAATTRVLTYDPPRTLPSHSEYIRFIWPS